MLREMQFCRDPPQNAWKTGQLGEQSGSWLLGWFVKIRVSLIYPFKQL